MNTSTINLLLDPACSKLFNKVKDKFQKKFKEEVPFTYVREALVDGKEAIIVFVDESEEASGDLVST